jgi:class 3 adenylate cyclase
LTVIEGERKTMTALLADIKGSTDLMEDLDPEEARAIIDPLARPGWLQRFSVQAQ